MTRFYFVAAIFLTSCTSTASTAPPPTTTTTASTTTTTATTTTVAPATTHTHVRRADPPEGMEGAARSAPAGDDFWHRLALCESGMRVTRNRYVGFFQLSRDTAAKVGIDGSEPYEEQRAGAQEWARRIHPREGTRAGWPVCWWRAA